MHTEFVHFKERHLRSEYVAERFKNYLKKRVADIGCFKAPLRSILTECDYVGVDVAGEPDIHFNLDSPETLPFDDNAFNAVLCIEVLEHLDHLHFIFDELVRISGEYIIVSLPNCWRDARGKIEKGKGDFLHYGLPLQKPTDRHKWFFNSQQAEDFLIYQADRHHLKICEFFLTEKPSFFPIRLYRKIRYPGKRYSNRYSNTVWVVYQKSKS